MRSLPQSTRGLEHKLPPRDVIIAHAIFTSKHSGAQAKTPPERCYHRSCDLYLKALGGSSTNSPQETLSSLMRSLPQSTRGLEHKLPPRDVIIAHAIFTSKHSGDRAQTPPERRYHRSCDLYLKALGGSSTNSPRETLSSLMQSLPQSTRGLEHKLLPGDAIIAHAIFTSKHSGARAQTPPSDAIISHSSFTSKHSGGV